jgi:hypothetical protein
MKPEILEKATKLYDSIKNIDYATEFISTHEKVFLNLQSGFGETASFLGFTKEVQEFLIYEALPMYRARIANELDKL